MSTERARSLRQRMSPPEAMLWSMLRKPPYDSYHFRRQVQIGRYYADFASHSARLVVEVDGSQHFDDAAQTYDSQRDAFIASEGYRVLRFTTFEVLRHIDGVGETILAHVATPTRPGFAGPPSPQGGGRSAPTGQQRHG